MVFVPNFRLKIHIFFCENCDMNQKFDVLSYYEQSRHTSVSIW